MSNNILEEHIRNFQNEYMSLLEILRKDISIDKLDAIIAELNLFWKLNKKVVELYIKNISIDFNTYIFIGGTFLDCKDFEHYPFSVMGKIHIIDDPISKYINLIDSQASEEFKEEMRKQVGFSINDNIEILQNYSDNFYIFPISYYESINDEENENRKLSDDMFLSLFKNEYSSIKEYLNANKEIKDVINNLKDEAKSVLVFDEYEDANDDIKTRFYNYMDNHAMPFNKKSKDGLKFYLSIIGFIIQAANIIEITLKYNFVPYIRYSIAFRYFILIVQNIEYKNMDYILLRAVCAHIIYKVFDKDKVKNIEFKRYMKLIDVLQIENKLLSEIETKDVDYKRLSPKKIEKIVIKLLADIK